MTEGENRGRVRRGAGVSYILSRVFLLETSPHIAAGEEFHFLLSGQTQETVQPQFLNLAVQKWNHFFPLEVM